ncbi:MAG: hypothetical protein AABN95_26685 [Acidobacteriota bacterium]
MNYGLLALVLLQFCLSVVCLAAAVRLWNIQSAHERETSTLATAIAEARKDAARALQVVESLELSHYKALQGRQLALETEVAAWRVKVDSLDESVKSLSAKLASREKIEKRNIERPAVLVPEPEAPAGPMTVEQLIAAGHAIPLDGNPAGQPSRNGNFGRKV